MNDSIKKVIQKYRTLASIRVKIHEYDPGILDDDDMKDGYFSATLHTPRGRYDIKDGLVLMEVPGFSFEEATVKLDGKVISNKWEDEVLVKIEESGGSWQDDDAIPSKSDLEKDLQEALKNL